MKLRADFKLELRRELERRVTASDLPSPMLQRLAGLSERLAAPRIAGHFLGARSLDAEMRAQTVVNAFGSPSLLIREGSFVAPVSETWAAVLEPHRAGLEAVIPAVGRIEVDHHPSRRWLGTGVLVAPTVLVTNRHVALLMAEEQAGGWTFTPGSGGHTVAARIDFREEHGVAGTAEFPLVDVLAVENENGPDLAFLRVAEHEDLPRHAELGGTVGAQDAVAAIGYTSREPGMPPEVEEILESLFGGIYDVKRLAPGRVLGTGADQLSHDCSTQGGNSGSALVDIETALVAGVHYEGGLSENFSVPVGRIRERLDALA